MAPRYCICYEWVNHPDWPVLPLTGTEDEIACDLAHYLARHPEISYASFVEYDRRAI